MALPKFSMAGGPQKLLVPLGVLLVVGGGGATTMYITKQTSELRRVQGELGRTQRELAEAEAQNQEIGQQLSSLQTERKTLEQRLGDIRTKLSDAEGQLQQLQTSLSESQSRAGQLSSERDALQAQLATVTRERDTVQQQAARLQEDKSDLERSVLRLRGRLELLDRDYRQLAQQLSEFQSRPPERTLAIVNIDGQNTTDTAARVPAVSAIPGTVELPPIIVRKEQAGMAVPVRGKVVEINDPHNFVILDKGSVDGVRVGMTFDLMRGAGSVGRVTVVRVRPQLSACDIVRASTPGPVQAGDLAVQSSP